jgi:hypothetical protein
MRDESDRHLLQRAEKALLRRLHEEGVPLGPGD